MGTPGRLTKDKMCIICQQYEPMHDTKVCSKCVDKAAEMIFPLDKFRYVAKSYFFAPGTSSPTLIFAVDAESVCKNAKEKGYLWKGMHKK